MSDPSYVTALVGLAGAAIGGFTSLATTWLTQHSQARATAIEADRARREALYTAFINEGSRLFGDALGHQTDDITGLETLYALVARLRLFASAEVVAAAEAVVAAIVQAYASPNRTLRDLRLVAHEGGLEPLLEFSEACRTELAFANGPRSGAASRIRRREPTASARSRDE